MTEAQSIAFGKIDIHWIGAAPSVCGLVDIGEEQDSFNGAERFVYAAGAIVLEELDGAALVVKKWDDLCK